MANRGLGWHQDATTFDAWFTDLIDTLVAPANGTGWSDVAGGSGVTQRRILQHTDGLYLDLHRKAFKTNHGNPGDSRGDTWYEEFFMGFFDAYDAANKRPTAAANVSICGGVIASVLNAGSGTTFGAGTDYGSWLGQFYWWVDSTGFVALFKPDAGLTGWGSNGGATANTLLIVLERIPAASREQVGGTNWYAYITGGETGTVSGGYGGGYYAGQGGRSLNLTGTQGFWNVAATTQPTWYDRWHFAHPFSSDNGYTNATKTTGHAGRSTTQNSVVSPVRFGATWPYEAGAASSEAEGAYGGARRAVGGNDKVYFQFPWYSEDYLMERINFQSEMWFRGQLSRGLLDGDQVAYANGAVTKTYLCKIFGSFTQGIFLRYA